MRLCNQAQRNAPLRLCRAESLGITDTGNYSNYSATSKNMKLVHWPLMGAVLHLVQREGAWAGWGPPSPLLAVPNVTAHPSTASVPTTVLLYDGPFLCGFNVAIKGVKGTECSLNGYYLTLHHYNLTLKKTFRSDTSPTASEFSQQHLIRKLWHIKFLTEHYAVL